MNQDEPELSLEESIKQVLETLPPVIREYLAQEKYTPVARSLMSKYNLRIDQGGVLEREIMLLLMGIDDPAEFTRALIEEARLSEEIVTSIARDVNEKIFMPLRKEEEMKGIAAPKTIEPPAAIQPPPKSNSFMPTRPIPVAPANVAHSAPLLPKTVLPTRAVMQSGKDLPPASLLEDHEEPHIAFEKTPAASAAPTNLPGMLPPEPRPVLQEIEPKVPPQPFIAPRPAPAPVMQPQPLAPAPTPITSYAKDPYREPIDEPPAA